MESTNFIEEIIESELAEGKVKKIVTRFPPEPNGYLHVGHAKSLAINFGIKKKYNGECNLRFDDTNPTKEDVEYVNSIKEDIKWLGFTWDRELYASDYFDQMYEFAVKLIKDGKAYVCDMSAEEISRNRGTLTEPGVESPARGRSIEENLRLFEGMKNGEFKDGEKVLRAKIDMASPNINMRDPVLYRVLRAKHHRTGDKWCIYPMYDFAHPISDCIEGITHSICTLEFEDHRPLYDWVKYNCGFGDNPRQIEFARLGLTRTIMSKRYLKKLVDTGVVDGWDDPRMPTLSGMRERGYPAEALLDFCDRIGVAKSNSMVEASLLEHCVRENLNANATRVMAVKEPLKLEIVNLDSPVAVQIDNNPAVEGAGTHEATLTREIYIEKSDFSLDPPPKYHRLKVGGMVRLKGAYVIKYLSHETDENGNVTKVLCEYIPETMSGEANAGIKVKGVLHWAPSFAEDVVINDYDYLLDEIEDGRDFNDRLNPVTKVVYHGKAEAFLSSAKPQDKFQFMRLGYYVKNKKGEYNLIVGLKDSYKA